MGSCRHYGLKRHQRNLVDVVSRMQKHVMKKKTRGGWLAEEEELDSEKMKRGSAYLGKY